ncbi:MAG: tRNA pseudouridine(55) synthase TruB [Betaproteobacteria bacterium]|nr:tRNA pseudouridine(55) synthase TruB [Betaproteobacteria bacterium]
MKTDNSAGFVAIDKPAGPSSAQAVALIKRRLPGKTKAGHSGTLDPLASGLLVVALGSATRLLRYLPSAKRYLVTILFGVCTDTDDISGKVLAQASVPDDWRTALGSILTGHVGQINQAAPAFSALKHRGRPLYQYARAGHKIEPKIRQVRIDRIDLLDAASESPDQVQLDVRCGPGVYMRSLARDLGEELGCGGTMAALRRIECNGLSVDSAQPLAENQVPQIIEPLELLAGMPRFALTDCQAKQLRNGQDIQAAEAADGRCAAVSAEGILLGIAKVEQGLLRPECVLAGHQ